MDIITENKSDLIIVLFSISLAFALSISLVILGEYPVYQQLRYGVTANFERSRYLENNLDDKIWELTHRIGNSSPAVVSIEGVDDKKIKFCSDFVFRECSFFAADNFPRSFTTITLDSKTRVWTTLSNDNDPQEMLERIKKVLNLYETQTTNKIEIYKACINSKLTGDCPRP